MGRHCLIEVGARGFDSEARVKSAVFVPIDFPLAGIVIPDDAVGVIGLDA